VTAKPKTHPQGQSLNEAKMLAAVTGPNYLAAFTQRLSQSRQAETPSNSPGAVRTAYSGYERFEFDIPTGTRGDCFDRTAVRVEEMRQSLRIVRQCLEQMPAGEHQSRHPLTTPPLKDQLQQSTMHDIETLVVHHFVEIGWGPVIPAGEACGAIEATKGINSYDLTSDGGGMLDRTRIRTPSFPHLQMFPAIAEAEEGGLLERQVQLLSMGDTLCTLGPGAMEPLRSALRHFRDDRERHIDGGAVPIVNTPANIRLHQAI